MEDRPPQDEALPESFSAHCVFTPGKQTYRACLRGITEPMDPETLTRSVAVQTATAEARRSVVAAAREQHRASVTATFAAPVIAVRKPAQRAREHRSARTVRKPRTSGSGDDPGPGERIPAARRDALRRRAASIEARLRLDKTATPEAAFAEATKGFKQTEKEIVISWLRGPLQSAVLAEGVD